MALAKKCDRCGAYYDYYEPKELSVCEFNAIVETIINKKGEIVAGWKEDLCPRCRKSFKKWLKGEK